MQQSINTDRFIPVRKSEILEACINHANFSNEQTIRFEKLAQLVISTIHFEYHLLLEELKNNYAPFDPNADTLTVKEYSQKQLSDMQQQFSTTFAQILNAGNFEKVTQQDLNDALTEESLFKVRLEVEFDDFEEVVFYRRGEYEKTELISKYWGLLKQQVTFTNYDKVAVYIKFKNKEYFEKAQRGQLNFEPSSTIIKLFQNVPKADLEMLFPNSEVKMRPIDKAIIGGSALIGGGIMLATKLGASIVLLLAITSYYLGLSNNEVTIGTKELLALGAAAGVLGGFIFKEWSKFKNRKLKFMKALADNLYFKNMDNNAGVFHHLIDSAEEEECKETILAYYFLLKNNEPMTEIELDSLIEDWFKETFDFAIDFEVDDALQKLIRFELVTKLNDKYQANSIDVAHTNMDKKWDNLF